MVSAQSQTVNMLAVLIDHAAAGKKVVLQTKLLREVIKIEREGQPAETVILSVEYSGTVDGNPFAFQKNYSFVDDSIRYALECLLIANNRLQMDYDRLKEAGIGVPGDFFTLQNSFIGLSGDASLKSPALRLQDFIHLFRAGAGVSVHVNLSHPSVSLTQGGVQKKGFGCMAGFTFTTKDGKTTVEKLYGLGSYDDPKAYQAEIKTVATKRLERDCERLRRAGIKVDNLSF